MNITILTVDTDYTRTLLNSKLDEQNYTVISETNNYEDALQLYKTYLPDIIIVDIDLGGTSKGLAFIDNLLKLDSSAQIITLSTFFKDSTKAKLLKSGINRLVMKPYQPAHIWEQIDEICYTNDMEKLREDRENIKNNKYYYNDFSSKGDQLNDQILSLRRQIAKSRNTQKNEDSNPNYMNPNNPNNNFNIDPSTLFTFSEEDNIDEPLNYCLNNDKENISNKTKDTSISFYDSGNNFCPHSENSRYFTANCLSKINEEQLVEDNLNGYLGLHIFIDREKIYDLNDNSLEHESTLKPRIQKSKKRSLFKNILKMKGDK